MTSAEFYGGSLDGARVDFSIPPDGELTLSCGCRFATWLTENGPVTGGYPCGRDADWHQLNLSADEIAILEQL